MRDERVRERGAGRRFGFDRDLCFQMPVVARALKGASPHIITDLISLAASSHMLTNASNPTGNTTATSAIDNSMNAKPDSLALEAKQVREKEKPTHPRTDRFPISCPFLTTPPRLLHLPISIHQQLASNNANDDKKPTLDDAKLLLQNSQSLMSVSGAEAKKEVDGNDAKDGAKQKKGPPLAIDTANNANTNTTTDVATLSDEEASSTLALGKLKAADADPADISNLVTAPSHPGNNNGFLPSQGQDNLALMSSLTSHIQFFDYAAHAADLQQRQQLAELQQQMQQQLDAAKGGHGEVNGGEMEGVEKGDAKGDGKNEGSMSTTTTNVPLQPLPFVHHPINQGIMHHPHALADPHVHLHAQAAWMIHHQQLLAAGVGGGTASAAQVGDAATSSTQPSEMAGGTITSPPPLGGQPQPQIVYLPAETLEQYHGRAPVPAAMPTSAPTSTTSNTTASKKRKTIEVAEGERAPQRRFSTAGQDHLHFSSENSSRIPMTTNAPREVEMLNPTTRERVRLFTSCSEAARIIGINRTKLSRCCRGGGGVLVSGTSQYYFRYTENVPEPENTFTAEATETSASAAGVTMMPTAAAAAASIPLPVAVHPVQGTDEETAAAAATAAEAMLGL